MDVRITRVVGLPKPEYYESLYAKIEKTLQNYKEANYRFRIYFQDVFNVIEEDVVKIKVSHLLDSTLNTEIIFRAKTIKSGVTMVTGGSMSPLVLSRALHQNPLLDTIVIHKEPEAIIPVEAIISEAPLFHKIDFPQLIKPFKNQDEYLPSNQQTTARHQQNDRGAQNRKSRRRSAKTNRRSGS